MSVPKPFEEVSETLSIPFLNRHFCGTLISPDVGVIPIPNMQFGNLGILEVNAVATPASSPVNGQKARSFEAWAKSARSHLDGLLSNYSLPAVTRVALTQDFSGYLSDNYKIDWPTKGLYTIAKRFCEEESIYLSYRSSKSYDLKETRILLSGPRALRHRIAFIRENLPLEEASAVAAILEKGSEGRWRSERVHETQSVLLPKFSDSFIERLPTAMRAGCNAEDLT